MDYSKMGLTELKSALAEIRRIKKECKYPAMMPEYTKQEAAIRAAIKKERAKLA